MKKNQNQAALTIAVLSLLLGLSTGKIYQQQLQLSSVDKTTALPLSAPHSKVLISASHQLNANESILEAETARIKKEMAQLQSELEAARRAHEQIIDRHLRELGRL